MAESVTGGAGTSMSKVVVDGERRRATTVVAEAVVGQVAGTRNERGTSFVKPTVMSNVTAEPGCPVANTGTTVSDVPSDAGSTTSCLRIAQPAGGRLVPDRVIGGVAVTGTVTEMGPPPAFTGTCPDAPIPCDADAIIATSEPGFRAPAGPFQLKFSSAPVTVPTATNPDALV